MPGPSTESTRIHETSAAGDRDSGRYVLYWMHQSQRAWGNPALEVAIHEANERGLPVACAFGLTADYPDANARHYAFLLQGLRDVADGLRKRKIAFVVRRGDPAEVAVDLAADAAIVVCDRGYLRHQRKWRRKVAREAGCTVLEVEGDVVVPVDVASERLETAARTFRPRVEKKIDDHLVDHADGEPEKSGRRLGLDGDVDVTDVDGVLDTLGVDDSVPPVNRLEGGTDEARRHLTAFLRQKLSRYDDEARDPVEAVSSLMSPYLHFGQISPVEIALKVRRAKSSGAGNGAAFLEELIVRRELAANFVWRCDDYDSFRCLPDWARKTLEKHEDDEREHVYTRNELEAGETHDRYWNAAMKEMRVTGFLHNYMRMYWGKKILEWSNTPEYAYRTALHLNNKYFLDGRDMNSYANVAWCFGLHDRAWQERKIFGKVRYMNAAGLERKFDMDAYCEAVEKRVAAEPAVD